MLHHACLSLDGHVIAILFQRFDTDSLDFDQVLYRHKGPVLGPMLDNGFSPLLADALERARSLWELEPRGREAVFVFGVRVLERPFSAQAQRDE